MGRSQGQSTETLGHYGVKAGVAQFIGHNEEWNPVAHPERWLTGDTGDWQQVGPGLVSYCPYVGLRYVQIVAPDGGPNGFRTGKIIIQNNYSGAVTIRLFYPPHYANVWRYWNIGANAVTFLAINNEEFIIGSDWGIQIVFGNGVTSAVRKVGSIATYNNNAFTVPATRIQNG
jgi:hypothetical protein